MMKRLMKLQKDSQGFTLVELMIVVAIIGILAAIAIPQFAAYRIRGYNAAAQSDVRNANTSEAAFFADWQTYGATEMAATLAAAVTTVGGAGAPATMAIAAPASIPMIAHQDNSLTIRALQIPVGNGITVIANTNAAAAVAGQGALSASFTGFGKHIQGDAFYAVDSDSTAVYQDSCAAVAACGVTIQLAAAHTEPSTANADDVVTAAAAPSGGTWVVK